MKAYRCEPSASGEGNPIGISVRPSGYKEGKELLSVKPQP
jgi:hypothetical protein